MRDPVKCLLSTLTACWLLSGCVATDYFHHPHRGLTSARPDRIEVEHHYQMALNRLELLRVQGVDQCLPADSHQIDHQLMRVNQAIRANLLIDAATDIIAVERSLVRLDNRMDMLQAKNRCPMPTNLVVQTEPANHATGHCHSELTR